MIHSPHMKRSDCILEYPTCPLCGESGSHFILESEENWIPDGYSRGLRFSVVRCSRCGVCYTSPRFPENQKHLAFAGSYPFYDRARRSAAPPSQLERRAFDRRIQQILRAHPDPAYILDIGMGDGSFLSAMKQQGWSVAGIDMESSVITYAQSRLGIQNCWVSDIERDPLPAGPFEIITLWGVLQLAYHPRELLAKLQTILSPGGILALGLSNIDGAGAKLFRSHWHGLGLPRHLIHFNPMSLTNLLEQSGYRVAEIVFETPGWIVNGSVNAALNLPWPINKAARFIARTALGFLGHCRWGDTLCVLAQMVDNKSHDNSSKNPG
jgi:SAM-dependent methyltransferase